MLDARELTDLQWAILDGLIPDLGHRLLAAHREHGMAEANQNADEADGVRQRGGPLSAVTRTPNNRLPGWRLTVMCAESCIVRGL
jgi:hypothetical protein